MPSFGEPEVVAGAAAAAVAAGEPAASIVVAEVAATAAVPVAGKVSAAEEPVEIAEV